MCSALSLVLAQVGARARRESSTSGIVRRGCFTAVASRVAARRGRFTAVGSSQSRRILHSRVASCVASQNQTIGGHWQQL